MTNCEFLAILIIGGIYSLDCLSTGTGALRKSSEGNLYGATHVYNSVVRISPDRRITIIAGLEDGVAGSTAVAFGRAEGDRQNLYVTTNGGMNAPPPGGVQPGRVVQIKTDKTGYFEEEG